LTNDETTRPDARRKIEVIESERIPALDIVFGFGPAVPFLLGSAAAWLLQQPSRMIALQLVTLWGSAILLFLSGVRRGLSFRTEDGPTWPQIATMLALFCLGLCALAALLIDALTPALITLWVGYAAVFLLDPIAARRGEAPLHFSRLRRLQIPIILTALAVSISIAFRS
jgi:hypothetical protein